MTYADNLSEEGIDSQYLLVMAPRREVTSWTLVSGSVYSKSFDYGHVTEVFKDDTALVEAASVAATTNGKFYYDYENETLYVNVNANPAGFDMIVTYELYFGSFDAHWYRSPLDSTSREVYYEPLITSSPQIQSSVSESIFGYLQSSSTQCSLSNLTQFFNRHVYDSSFNDADFRLYHQLGELSVANLKLVYQGLINSVDYNDKEVTLRILDRTNIFDNEFRNADADNNFFGESDFPNIDPTQKNRPIRTIYGAVDGVIGVNYDYSTASGAGVNRYFCLQADDSDLGAITGSIPSGSTTTRTYFTGASGVRIGDDVYIDSASGASADFRAEVTAIGAGYFEHAAVAVAAPSGSTFRRGWIGNAYVIKNGVTTRLRLDTDYSERLTENVGAIALDQTGCESRLGAMVQSTDTVYCRVYGKKNSVSLDSVPLGSNSTTTGNLTNIIAVFVDLLKGAAGLSESELDIDTLADLVTEVTDEVGFSVPKQLGDDFPVLKDLIISLCQTGLLRIYLDDDGLWSMSQVGPAGSYSKQIQDDEILTSDFNYLFDYQDVISDVIVNYYRSEVGQNNQVVIDGSFRAVRATSSVAQRLHRITKQKTFETLHILEAEAQVLANRLRYYLGDRRGILKLSTKNRFFGTKISDVIRVSRTRLPGYEYDEDTEQTRDLVTQATNKSLTEIDIELDDQKGIEDNSGSW